ncbi:MAG: nucleotidyltransferase family protein [Caldilineaceae bacterium]|nr:nucleotidyltransferase family protein [Caldilineaceae bacterium]
MSSSSAAKSYLPDPTQELLLRAALLQGPEAVRAWEAWIERVDVEGDHLDGGSYRTLPLLHHNLIENGVDHPLLARFKGIRRRVWYKNQIVFRMMAELLSRLHDAGMPTLVLKGAALTVGYYGDYSLRPMEDFDVLAPTLRADEAITLIDSWGWKAGQGSAERLLSAPKKCRHAESFTNATGQSFDLHWNLLHTYLRPDADDPFWSHAIPLEVGEAQTLTLAPSDQLLHVCAHGASWNRTPSFRWVLDAWLVLHKGGEVDWGRLVSQAERCDVVLPVADTLGYLRSAFDAPIPEEVVRELSSRPVGRVTRKGYEVMAVPDSQKGPIRTFWRHYARFYHSEFRSSALLQPLHFLRFMMCMWGVDHLWQLPQVGFRKMVQRVREMAAHRAANVDSV